jgi:hypothetical protein
MMSIPKYIKSNNQLIFYNNFSPFITACFVTALTFRPDRNFPLDENEMQNLCMFCEMSARVLCVETGLEVDGRDIDPIIPDIINSHLKGFGYSKKDLLTKKKYLYHQLKLIRYMQEDDDLSKSDTKEIERVIGLAAEAMNRLLRKDGDWEDLFGDAVWDPQRTKYEKPEAEKSYEKNKEKKSSKEKTEKNRKSDFKSKSDKSRTEEKTKDKLSVDFSLLGKNKENYNRKTRSYWSEEPTKQEVLLKNSQQESAKEVKRMFSIIFSKFPNNNLPIWIDLIRFPFVILLFFAFFALIGAFLSLVRLVGF